MDTRTQSAPAALSAEGRAILADPAQPMQDLSAETLPRVRAITRAMYADMANRAVDRAGVDVAETEIAGVPCLTLTPPRPAAAWPVLYGYGGGFIMGSPFEDLIVAAPLCARTGARVIIPHYRLAPEHPWPAPDDDGYAVYRTLSGAPFAMVGESAGGNLALTLMQRARRDGLALPRVLGLMSPWCDLTHAGDSLTANDGRDPTLSLAWVKIAAEYYAGAADPADPAVSPIFGDYAGGPPTILTTGTRDLLQSQVVRLARVMRGAGVQVDLRVWDGLWHVFEFDDRLPEAAQSVSEIADFLVRHMAR